MHEAFLSALREPLRQPLHYFTSAKTPMPIGFTSHAARIVMVQWTLSPSVFVIQAVSSDDQSADAQGSVCLITEDGPVLVDLPDGGKGSFAHRVREASDVPRLIMTAQGVDRQPFADNCRLAWLCNDYRPDPRDRDSILRTLARRRQLTLNEAANQCLHSEDPIGAVLSLVCADFAEADLMTSPIGPTTKVSIRRRKGAFV